MRRVAAAAVVVSLAGAAAPAVAAAPGRMLVTAREWSLTSSRQTLPRGTSIVQLANGGEDSHDLALRRLDAHGRPHGRTITFPETRPGEVATERVRLARGRWELWCTLRGHRAAGMHARLRVR